SRAQLQAAQFEGVQAPEINMEEADISGLHGSDQSDFTKGNFKKINGNGSIWEGSILNGADFTRSRLARAQFSDGSLRGTTLDRADLSKAVFDDACLLGAVLTNANLLQASFDRADLTQANFQGSNLYEAGFWDTVVDRTNFHGANLKGTLLA